MTKQLAALAGAIVLIVAAIFIRGALVGDDGGGGSDGPRRSGKPVVGCTPDLAPICDKLAESGVIAEAPPTFDLGSDPSRTGRDGDVVIDGWITWDGSWGVDADPARGPVPWVTATPLAAAPLMVGVRDPSALDDCGLDPVTWSCLVSGARAGNVQLGLGPATTAQGLARMIGVGDALAGDSSIRDMDPTALDDVLGSSTSGVANMATQRQRFSQPGYYNAVLGPEQLFRSSTGSTFSGVDVFPVAPEIQLVVVLAERDDVDLGRVADAMSDDAIRPTFVATTFIEPGAAELLPAGTADDMYALREVAKQ